MSEQVLWSERQAALENCPAAIILIENGAREYPFECRAYLLDEVWYLDLAEETRLQRLIGRHMEFGRDSAEARDRATGSDQRNAVLIEASRDYASLVVSLGRY